MARLLLRASLIVLLGVLVGCNGPDSGRGQMVAGTVSAPAVRIAASGETDIVEQLAVHRQGYRKALEMLVQHYGKVGNNMKLSWAEKELSALNSIPQYNYIVAASVAGPNLRANEGISEADYLYNEAVRLEKQAGQFMVVKDENTLRLALDKYNQVIKRYPSSDKIDDAAFRAGVIYEHFKDYTIAAMYYQRAFEWDAETPHPARFKAAYVLDTHLHRRAEALELYKAAVERLTRIGQHREWKDFAENRIRELEGGQSE